MFVLFQSGMIKKFANAIRKDKVINNGYSVKYLSRNETIIMYIVNVQVILVLNKIYLVYWILKCRGHDVTSLKMNGYFKRQLHETNEIK